MRGGPPASNPPLICLCPIHADNLQLAQNAPQPAPIPQPLPQPSPSPSPAPQPGAAAGTFGAITPKETRNIVWIKNTSNTGIDGFKTITFKVIDENSNLIDDWKVQSEMNSLVAQRSGTSKYYAIVQTNGELPDNIANRTYTEVTINGADVTNTDPYYWSTIHQDKLVGANFSESIVRGSGGSSPSPAPPGRRRTMMAVCGKRRLATFCPVLAKLISGRVNSPTASVTGAIRKCCGLRNSPPTRTRFI